VLMPAIAERIAELWEQAAAYIRPRLLGEG
jgi:hypothetical protein